MFNDLVFNRKFRQLSEADCWRYVKICALHNAGKYLGARVEDIVEDMRVTVAEYKTTLKALKKVKLLEKNGTIHDWSEMQKGRDYSTPRTQKHRASKKLDEKEERKGTVPGTEGNSSGNAPDQNRTEQKGLTPLGNPIWKGDPFNGE